MKKTISACLHKLVSQHDKQTPNYPIWLVLLVLSACVAASYFAQDFRFDASADTLVAEDDPQLAYYREISEHFNIESFLVLTYMPKSEPLIARQTISDLKQLVAKLKQVEGVRSVDSILEVPLLKSPPMPISKLASEYRTLLSPDVDLQRAAKELTQSPVFRNLLISADGNATAIRIQPERNEKLESLREKRNRLRHIEDPTQQQEQELENVEKSYRKVYSRHLAERDQMIAEIRTIRNGLGEDVVSYLGGLPLIASATIDYVKRDVVIFGAAVVVLIALMLFVIFRQWRWVLVPLLSSGVTVLLTIGILGFLKQPTTVISSNFISLQVIFTIAFSVHLIVRYRELRSLEPDASHSGLVLRTMKDKLAPCVYMALTTMVAFASLITSDIIPVMDFGWIMSLGILVSFLVTYSFFAGLLMLLPNSEISSYQHRKPMPTKLLSYLSVKHTGIILGVTTAGFVVAALGMERLSLDNRFVNYFRSGTEIREGLVFIDKHFGGTIPMDIILSLDPYQEPDADESSDFFTQQDDDYPQRYWYTPTKLQYLEDLHEYLKTKHPVGKILSLHNFAQVAQDLRGEPLGAVELVTALSAMPDDIRKDLIGSFAAPKAGLLRISARLHEVGVDYHLDTLITDIDNQAADALNLADDDVHVTGMAVLFNGMLQHLFESQKSTLVFVILAILVMFTLLLRSILLAVLGLLPNVLAAATALGFMGYMGIPLDVMTITIAAVIIGIGVDDAIHYLHRFRQEYAVVNNARNAVINSHNSIGNAIYYTSITVIIGFSVLSFSNFVPTVHFGLMTAMAMVLALLANLAILPSLLILTHYWKDKNHVTGA